MHCAPDRGSLRCARMRKATQRWDAKIPSLQEVMQNRSPDLQNLGPDGESWGHTASARQRKFRVAWCASFSAQRCRGVRSGLMACAQMPRVLWTFRAPEAAPWTHSLESHSPISRCLSCRRAIADGCARLVPRGAVGKVDNAGWDPGFIQSQT